MFTGIIQSQGRVESIVRRAVNTELTISAPELVAEIDVGDSVAINGVCLTAERVSPTGSSFTATAVAETLSRTTLGKLQRGVSVNLELALLPTDRMGGHFLQGHVDAIGRCLSVTDKQGSWLIQFSYPSEFKQYLVEKGSIAVDGISLTAVAVHRDHFAVSIIPHTFTHTTLGAVRAGHEVNLEFDLIGKYIAKQQSLSRETITIEKLREYGY